VGIITRKKTRTQHHGRFAAAEMKRKKPMISEGYFSTEQKKQDFDLSGALST
jgi:hypothetical protein